MKKYIDADKLKAEIKRQQIRLMVLSNTEQVDVRRDCALQGGVYDSILATITSLQQEQQDNIIQWTGNNLKEVIDFTGKSPRFGEWFKSWEEYENYVHSHNDILKLFCEDGSHYEVPIGAWIVKTPDGYNVPSVAKYVQQEQQECIEKTARISPGLLSNFGTSTYVLDVDLTQDEMAKMASFGFNSDKIKIKIVCE